MVSIHTLYSGKYGVGTMTSSPGFVMAPRLMVMDAAAPTVMYTWAAFASMPVRRAMLSAMAWRTAGMPAAGEYACSSTGGSFISSAIVSATFCGAGMLGLPME